jgi:hypothetical protein
MRGTLNFYNACVSGNICIIKQNVKDGIDIHDEDEAGFRYACSYGRIEVVEYLTTLYKYKYNNSAYGIINIHTRGAEGF